MLMAGNIVSHDTVSAGFCTDFVQIWFCGRNILLEIILVDKIHCTLGEGKVIQVGMFGLEAQVEIPIDTEV